MPPPTTKPYINVSSPFPLASNPPPFLHTYGWQQAQMPYNYAQNNAQHNQQLLCHQEYRPQLPNTLQYPQPSHLAPPINNFSQMYTQPTAQQLPSMPNYPLQPTNKNLEQACRQTYVQLGGGTWNANIRKFHDDHNRYCDVKRKNQREPVVFRKIERSRNYCKTPWSRT